MGVLRSATAFLFVCAFLGASFAQPGAAPSQLAQAPRFQPVQPPEVPTQPPVVPPQPSQPPQRLQPSPQPSPQPARPSQPGSPQPAGVPAEFVGVWQQVVDSFGDIVDPRTGFRFAANLGYRSDLVIHADGSYEIEFYAWGTRDDCARMHYYFEWSNGSISVDGNRLILQPLEHRVGAGDCGASSSSDLRPEPIVYQATYVEDVDSSGESTQELTLEGGVVTMNLTLLHRDTSMPGR